MMAGFEIPLRAVRQQVSSALDLVIQIERLDDGDRRITSISEVQRMESDVITMQELFTWKMEQITGERVFVGNLVSTGLRPTFLNKFEKRGIALPSGLFHELSGVRRIGRHGLMKHALRLGLAALAAAVLAGAASSATAPPRIVEAGGVTLPERAYILSLPYAKSISQSDVTVTENGGPVNNLTLHRQGNGARKTAVVIAIDESLTMKGKPIANALAAARHSPRARTTTSRSRSSPSTGTSTLSGRSRRAPRRSSTRSTTSPRSPTGRRTTTPWRSR